MQLELARQDSPLVIAVQNNNGLLVPIQGLDQFLYGDRDLRILCFLHGRELFDILYDDHGLIRYDDYNGPPVKTTISNFIVNQIFPILTLAASRATPHI